MVTEPRWRDRSFDPPATVSLPDDRFCHDQFVKLRLGIALWLLSWVPYGLILGLSGVQFTIAWTVEILLGIAGLAIAGSEFARAIKGRGWRGALSTVWQSLLHGKSIEVSE